MTETGMIQFTAPGIEADGYVAQAFSISKLSECHDQELIPASKLTDTFIAIVPVNATIEFIVRNILHYLRKDRSSLIHYHSPLGRKPRRIGQKRSKKIKSFRFPRGLKRLWFCGFEEIWKN